MPADNQVRIAVWSDEALGGARVTPDAGEAVSDDTAAQVGAEVVLDPVLLTLAVGVGRGGAGVGMPTTVRRRAGRWGGGGSAEARLVVRAGLRRVGRR
ncbi:MAG: hypothetical protein H0V12_10655 [Chloroflexi bacterium]|nr:hypothetical protein [Chloroflexota bacterium]